MSMLLPPNIKNNSPAKNWCLHREIARLRVCGFKSIDIASELGVSMATVSSVLKSANVIELVNHLQARRDIESVDVSMRITNTAKKAQGFLEDVVEGKHPVADNIRTRVCMDQLDRAGFVPVTRNVNMNLSGHFTTEDLDGILAEVEKAKAEGARSGTVEVEGSPVNFDIEEKDNSHV